MDTAGAGAIETVSYSMFSTVHALNPWGVGVTQATERSSLKHSERSHATFPCLEGFPGTLERQFKVGENGSAFGRPLDTFPHHRNAMNTILNSHIKKGCNPKDF